MDTETKYRHRVVTKTEFPTISWVATMHDKSGKIVHKEEGTVTADNMEKLKEYEEQARNEGVVALQIAEQKLLDQPLITFK